MDTNSEIHVFETVVASNFGGSFLCHPFGRFVTVIPGHATTATATSRTGSPMCVAILEIYHVSPFLRCAHTIVLNISPALLTVNKLNIPCSLKACFHAENDMFSDVSLHPCCEICYFQWVNCSNSLVMSDDFLLTLPNTAKAPLK